MGTADFDLSRDTNIIGVPPWENDTKIRENHGKFDNVDKITSN